MGKTIGGCICAICTDEVEAESDRLQAIHPCGHIFHEHCLKVWTQMGLSNNRATACPLCNQNYGTKDVLGLYFSDASRAEASLVTTPQRLSDRYRARAQEYQKTIRKLETDLKTSEKKKLEAERKGQGYLEELRVVRDEVANERKENSRLVNSLAKAQEDLRERSAHCEGLLERGEVMAEILAATTMNMELGDAMSTLISSPKGSARKDDVLFVLSKLLDMQKNAYKEPTQKGRDLGMRDGGAGQESGKLMEQVEGMTARMQGQIVKSEKDIAERRYFIRRSNKPVGFSYSDTVYKRPRPSPNDVNSGHPMNDLLSCPESKSMKVDGSKGYCRPSLASVHPNAICLKS